MKNKFWRSPFIFLVVASVCLIVFAYISNRLSQDVKTINKRVSSSREILSQVQAVENAIIYNESNVRAYIIKPGTNLNEVLEKVPVFIRQSIQKLKTLTASKSEKSAIIDSLSFYTEKRIEFSNQLILTRKEKGIEGAIALMESTDARALIAKTRTIVNTLLEIENQDLKNELNQREKTINRFTVLLLSIFVFIILSGIIYLFQIIKNYNQEKRESENAKYVDVILDNISDAVITTDADFKVRNWNKAAEKMYGLNPEKVKEIDIAEAVRSRVPEDMVTGIRTEMKNTGEWKGEVTHLNAEGHEIIVQSSRSAIINKEGKLTGFVSTNHDITERKLAENLLTKFNQDLSNQVKEKTAELTNIFERISDAFVAFDNNWNYTFVNKKAEELLGKTKEQLLNKNAWEIFPYDINNPFYLALHEAKKTQRPLHLELYYAPFDRWYQDNIFPSTNGISVYYHDITNKKKSEIALKESETKYRTLIEQASDGIFISDEDGMYVEVNKSGCEMMGYSNEEFKNYHIKDMVVIDEDFVPFRFAELNAGKSVIQPRKLKRKDGSYIHVEINARKLPDGKLLGIVRDMTDRIDADKKLQKEKELSDKIINSLPGLFYLSDPSPRLIRWNKAFEEVTGYSAEELGKMVPITLFEPEDQKKIKQSIEKTYTEGSAIVEARLLTKNGKKIPFFFTGVGIEYEGKPAMLGTGIDISDRIKAEEEKGQLLNTIQKSLDEIYLFNTENFHYEYANEGALRNLGYTIDEIYKLSPLDITPEMTLQKVKDLITPLFNNEKEKIVFETTHKRKDNTLYPVEVHIQLIEQGTKKVFLTIIRDITERKKVEEEIKKANERFELISKATNDALWEMNLVTNEKWGNDSFYQLYGLNRQTDSLNQLTLFSHTHPDDIEKLKSNLENSFKQKAQSLVEEYRFKTADGTYKTFLDRAFIKYDDSGKPVKLIGAMLDITERKKSEEKIKTANERFELIGKATNDALWEWNLETNELWGNEVHQNIYGLTIADPVPEDKVWRQRLHPDDRERVLKTVEESMASSQVSFATEYRLFTDNKGWINIYGSTYAVRNKEGKAIRLLGNMTDITELKKTEEALQNTEKRLQFLLSATPAIIYSSKADIPFGTTFISENVIEQTGYHPDEFYNDSNFWQNHLHPDDMLKILKSFPRLFEKGFLAIEYRFKMKDESYVWMHDEMKVVYDSENKPIEIVGYWINIDERKKAQEALASNEIRLRTIYEIEPECIKMLNRNSELLDMNPAGLAMIEADSFDTVKGKSLVDIVYKSYKKDFKKLVHDIFNGKSGKLSFQITGLKGTQRWLETLAVPMRDNTGNIYALLGVTRDITDKKRAEEELIYNELRFRTLTSNAPVGIFQTDENGKTIYVNETWLKYTGFTNDEAMGDKWLDALHPEDRNKVLSNWKQESQKRIPSAAEYRVVDKAGNIRWMSGRSMPLFVNGNEFIGHIGTLTDITFLKNAEAEIVMAKEKFEKIALATNDALWEANIETNEYWWNQQSYQLYGHNQNLPPLPFEEWEKRIHPDDREEIVKSFKNNMEDGNVMWDSEYRFLLPDNSYAYLYDRVFFYHKDGKLVKMIGSKMDITTRKISEEKLRFSEAKYRTLVDQAGDAIALFDEKGNILEANFSASQLSGYSIAELMNRTLPQILLKEELKKNPVDYNLLQKGVTTIKQRKLQKKDGTIVETEINTKVLPDGRFIAIIRDLTERINIQKQIEKEKDLSDKIIDSLPGIFYLMDCSIGKIVRWNKRVEEITGYSAEEIDSIPYLDLVDEKDKINLTEKLQEVLKIGNSEAEFHIKTKDGRHIAYYFTGWLVFLDGKPFIIGNALDISARKKAEQELDESFSSIRKLTSHLQNIREEERTNIAREIHDELGQLLTVMKMDVSWLNKKIISEPGSPVKNKIKELLEMIDGTVKTVRRISSELRPSLLDDLGLVAAIEWHLIEFEKRVGIKTNFTDATEEVILPDKIKTGIFRIFQESLTNVARHAEATKVSVRLEYKNKMFSLNIADNGIGFDKSEVKDKKTLGILGMKERTEMMGGIYNIVSSAGKGTSIIVKVPLSEMVENISKL